MRLNSPNRSLSLAAVRRWTRAVMNKSGTLEFAAWPTRGLSGYFVFWLVVGEILPAGAALNNCILLLRHTCSILSCRVSMPRHVSACAAAWARDGGCPGSAFHSLWKTCMFSFVSHCIFNNAV